MHHLCQTLGKRDKWLFLLYNKQMLGHSLGVEERAAVRNPDRLRLLSWRHPVLAGLRAAKTLKNCGPPRPQCDRSCSP